MKPKREKNEGDERERVDLITNEDDLETTVYLIIEKGKRYWNHRYLMKKGKRLKRKST